MASTMIALRRAAASALFGRIRAGSTQTRSIPALTLSRSFNTEAEGTSSISDDRSIIDVQRHPDRAAVSRRRDRAPSFFS
ncbi:hypothetical protein CRG98_038081, partial [Punica granatum]